jgi:L-threonylcarbamoyladenylate synthase
MTPWQLRQAAQIMRSGGVIAYPTETVYGLGCDPLHAEAVFEIMELKQRPIEKGLILIGGRLEHLLPYFEPLDTRRMAAIKRTWPGPVTWLLPARADVPDWLTGGRDTIALRITSHPVATALCTQFGGAIVSTSANLAGRPPAKNALQVRRYFGATLDYILCNADTADGTASEIRDGRSGCVIRAA